VKVLYITNKPIYPKIDGGCVAMDNFLNCLLNTKIIVKHICISTNKHPFKQNAYPAKQQLTIHNHFIDTDITSYRGFINLFKSGSYNVNRFHCKNLQATIKQEVEHSKYDCVILESLFTTTYIEAIRSKTSIPIFVRTHNLEHKIATDLAKNSTGIKKVYLSKLAKDLKTYEISALKKIDGILSISKADTEQIEALEINTPIKTIGVAIPIPDIQNNYDANGIFHLGAMNWQPNIEAVKRLVDIFPEIIKSTPRCKLHIAGSSDSDYIKPQTKKQIYFDGFVDNIQTYALKKGILVSPIISGSGIRIKILEMMAIGIPIITTKLGASGINYTDSNCLIIANKNTDIIAATLELIQNKDSRKKIGQNAIAYIRKNHNIEDISSEIIEFIKGT